MSIDRPTFHESWHRVAGLKPRLRAGVRIVRQLFRGELWMVAEDPSTGQYYRLSRGAWGFVGLLDGARTAGDAHERAAESLGDEAPTQGEAIALLGQLFGANLLAVDGPADAMSLLRRRTKRRSREARALLQSYLFFRVPLIDPDRFLSAVSPLVAWLFSPIGLVLWSGVLVLGGMQLAGRERELLAGVGSALDAENLGALFVTFGVVKLLHEFGHAAACKVLGRREAVSSDDPPGAVHSFGVMFFLLLPAPYVDTTSAWAFRSKWRRVIVGAAGMMVELAVASAAAMVWARTAEGTAPHAIAWNVMFLASAGTLLFNLNPLLRFDGYFMLCDVLELPNLSARAFESLKLLVKKHLWGLARTADPARSSSERAWLIAYALLAGVYRAAVCAGILLFISRQQLLLGAVLVLLTVVLWVLVPAAQIARYLSSAGELARRRGRAVLTTLAGFAALAAVIGAVPLPRWVRLEAVVEPIEQAEVFAPERGEVVGVLPVGARVTPDGDALVTAASDEWRARRRMIAAEIDRETVTRRASLGHDPAAADAAAGRIEALTEQRARADDVLASLSVRAPFEGVWLPAREREVLGGAMSRGDRLGRVVDASGVRLRASARQDQAALLIAEARPSVEVRSRAEPSVNRAGSIERIAPAAVMRDRRDDSRRSPGDAGDHAMESPAFELTISLGDGSGRGSGLIPGTTAEVRIRVDNRTLLGRAWAALASTLQQRTAMTTPGEGQQRGGT